MCKDCGGSSICEHSRQRSRCKDCGGSSICRHNRVRGTCKECGGSSICEHGRRRSACKECGGGSICEHARHKRYCKECGGAQFCKHNRRREHCSICNPVAAFNLYKRESARRNLAFTITVDEFKSIVGWPCLYCGESETPRGVDRWDNSVGYEFDNCRPCCGVCNRMKGTLSGRQFVAICERITSYTLLGE